MPSKSTLTFAVTIALGGLIGAPTAAAEPTSTYVALGDSAAAAPLVPPAEDMLRCNRSGGNYPRVLAAALGVSVVDVSCSSAASGDITDHPQRLVLGTAPTQLDAVGADTDLITISIGGNDVGLVGVALRCITFLPPGQVPAPCTSRYVTGGRDEISDTIRAQIPKWDKMFAAIRAKAPSARIVLVGYGTYVRPSGCFPQQPMHPADADYLQAKVDEINDATSASAAAHGIEFFDTRPVTSGHDGCAAPGDRYLEGILPSRQAVPLHPNDAGSAAIGAALADYLRGGPQ